ncbi:MAG: 16S rRNA (guanine(527)-N(7))-methyltransferase RsmG [Bacteroidales bacterium]|jgi:16S rRNA (guanine527-N7)-methyltransferase|nr:16S rRNA (guanine(527)-N(7))-methyltransferase RsmG [Bacteroidales bacterium]MBR3526207.1 16S rRNA (guanine(527)-N(7))-methyltransferase RsmG [Bacteroidales bacterium]
MEEILRYFPSLSERQIERFTALKALYDEWNARINVISRKDMDNFYEHHVLHSLALALPMKGMVVPGDRILDLGTGGGFPGIPLAIFFEQCDFLLCDSVGKKTKVASQVAEALGLQNVRVVNDRAENLPGSFDYVVSRAVTSLDKMLPWIKGRYDKGVLYLKGGDLDEEIDRCISRRMFDARKLSVIDISDFYGGEWFVEKKIVIIKR